MIYLARFSVDLFASQEDCIASDLGLPVPCSIGHWVIASPSLITSMVLFISAGEDCNNSEAVFIPQQIHVLPPASQAFIVLFSAAILSFPVIPMLPGI